MGRLLDRVAGSVSSVVTEEPIFHLSFDDGPHPEVTRRVLDLLDTFGVPATFFVLTEHVRRHPDVVHEILRRGHEVGLHGRSHLRISNAPWKAIVDEVTHARRDLEEMVGREIRFFRPSYGDHGLRSYAVAKASGLKTILWSVDTCDWKGISDRTSLRPAIDAMQPGGIGLMHDTTIGRTLQDEFWGGLIPRDRVVRIVLAALRRQGLRPVSLDDLLRTGPELHCFRVAIDPSRSRDRRQVP